MKTNADMQTQFDDRVLRIARAIAPHARDSFSPKQIILARHMAHDGANVTEIMSALGWTCTKATALKRLRNFNITPGTHFKHAHKGELTTIPDHNPASEVPNFKPKILQPIIRRNEVAPLELTPRLQLGLAYVEQLLAQAARKSQSASRQRDPHQLEQSEARQ